MFNNTNRAEVAAWIATGAAVIIAVIATKSAMPVWGMLIPLMVPYTHKDNKK